jgi:hypothetical protein
MGRLTCCASISRYPYPPNNSVDLYNPKILKFTAETLRWYQLVDFVKKEEGMFRSLARLFQFDPILLAWTVKQAEELDRKVRRKAHLPPTADGGGRWGKMGRQLSRVCG